MMILAETHQKMGDAINQVGLDMHGITRLFKAYDITNEFDHINRAIAEIQCKLSTPEFRNLSRKTPRQEASGYTPEPTPLPLPPPPPPPPPSPPPIKAWAQVVRKTKMKAPVQSAKPAPA